MNKRAIKVVIVHGWMVFVDPDNLRAFENEQMATIENAPANHDLKRTI